MSFIQLIFLSVIIYPLANTGKLVGVAWAVTFANFLCFILAFQEVLKITNESKKNVANAVVSSALVTLGIICLIYLAKAITLDKMSLRITFMLSILIGLSVYSIYAKILGFSFSNFLNSGNPFKKSMNV